MRRLFYFKTMAKINEITYSVRESLKEYTDDTELDDRYIVYLYNIKRAKYLRQELNNYMRTVDTSVKQSYCDELEEVPLNKCGINYTCGTLLRTKLKVPKPVELHTKTAITSVKSTNLISTPFNFISKERMSALEGSPFSRGIYAFLDDDDYIYVYSKGDGYKFIECITITGVFENPLDLTLYKDCCGCEEPTACFDENTSEYPLQPHFIDLIRDEIIQDLIRTKQIPEDKINDDTDL